MKISKLNLLVLMFALIALFNTKAFSQSSIGLGIEAGINIADISTTPVLNTSSRTGFMVGGFADFGVSRVVAIRPGVRFMMKGFSGRNALGVSYTDKFSYIEIPMLLKVRIPLQRIKPYFTAGPTLGIQLSASEDIINGLQPAASNDVSTSYETIDFGLYFGGGMDFNVAENTDVFTGFGYSLGLTNISKMAAFQGKNYGLQFTAGVKFNL